MALIPLLIAQFPRWLEYFQQRGPFTKPEQLASHQKTIELRKGYNGVERAVADPVFVQSLHDTLTAWGMKSRAARLRPLPEFSAALVVVVPTVAALERLSIDGDKLDVDDTAGAIWKVIEALNIAENNAQLVAGTKTLHHLLPELVPPMDREYTQRFFGWHNPQFQYGQEKCFTVAFAALVFVAHEVKARQFVGTHAWNTSVTKVLDNALVGLVRAIGDGAAT